MKCPHSSSSGPQSAIAIPTNIHEFETGGGRIGTSVGELAQQLPHSEVTEAPHLLPYMGVAADVLLPEASLIGHQADYVLVPTLDSNVY